MIERERSSVKKRTERGATCDLVPFARATMRTIGINLVAHERMPNVTHVQSNLVLPACLEFQFNERQRTQGLNDAVVCDGVFRFFLFVAGQVPPSASILIGNRSIHNSRRRTRHALHKSEIAPFDGVTAKERPPTRVNVARQSERDKARGAAIEPMQRADIGAAPPHALDVFAQAIERAIFARVPVSWNRQEPRGFVEHHDVVVGIGRGDAEAHGARLFPIGIEENTFAR